MTPVVPALNSLASRPHRGHTTSENELAAHQGLSVCVPAPQAAPAAWPLQPHLRARCKRQHTSSKQQSHQDQAQHGLKLPQLFSYSTGGGMLPANSFDSSLSGQATGQASTSSSCCEGPQPSPLQPTLQGRKQQVQPLELAQSQQEATQQELCATAAVPSSTAPDHPAGQHECDDDVSAQKAAAQARFAEQQRLQAGGSTSTRVDPAILQQELARLEQQGPQARVFASILLCNMLCCLMVLAARVSAVPASSKTLAGQRKGSAQPLQGISSPCTLLAQLSFHFLRPDAVCLMCGLRPKPQPQAEHCCCDCAFVCCSMQGPVREWSSGSWLQLPLLLALSASLGWLFISKLKPMHFANAAVEQQYAARSQYGRCLLDLWFSMAGCSGVLAAVRSDGRPPGTELPAATHLAALQSAVPVLLIAVLLSGVVLLLVAPRLYRRWREQLLFVGKLSIVLGTVALQPGCGGILQVGPGWLPLLGPSRAQTHAASILVAMGAVQAFLLLTLTVRVSAYIPMQLIHVSALLATVANSGTSGLGMVAYALQLLTCSLWAPTCILAQLESSSRRAFLARQLPHAKKA